MSTIWTPSGERPIRREPEPQAAPSAAASAAARPAGPAGEPTEEELLAQMEAVQQQLLETPASVVVANHCIGLFQLAALHLEERPPDLDEAKIAIDSMGAIVETLGPRLGEDEQSLRDALTQLRLAYVQRQAASGPRPAG